MPVVVSRDIAFVAGHGPLRADGKAAFTGPLLGPSDLHKGREAVQLTARNLLGSLEAALSDRGGLAVVRDVLTVRCFVLADAGFKDHDAITAVPCETFDEHLGTGRPGAVTTVAIGAAVFDLTVTVDATFALEL